jgi:hypothetical protein
VSLARKNICDDFILDDEDRDQWADQILRPSVFAQSRSMRPSKPYVPKNVSEIMDLLGVMMIRSPTFIDKSGHFADDNIDTIFRELNGGLGVVRAKLGEERYLKLREMSDRMRAHFEADPEDKTDGSLKGRDIILEMEDLLMQKVRKP